VKTHREQQRCDDQGAEQVTYPPVLGGQPERVVGHVHAAPQRHGDGRGQQRGARKHQHVLEAGKGYRPAHRHLHEPYTEQRREELQREKHAIFRQRYLRCEQHVGQHLRAVGKESDGHPVVGRVEQQEGEQGARGWPEHADAMGGDQQGETDADCEEVQREIHGPRLQRA
jgi:hypothetical protein